MKACPTPANCAVCGADIPPKARACPECGADERTGWDEQNIYDGLDLPEESFHGGPIHSAQELKIVRIRRAKTWFWSIIALVLLVVFIIGALAWR